MIEKHANKTPIFILNWNGIDDTIECLTSVFELNDEEFFVILMDNASDNDEGARLKQMYENHPLVVIKQFDTNFGFCKAHIKAYEEFIASRTDIPYIALLNNDTIIDPNWLSELKKTAMEKNAHVVASKMIQYYNRNLMDNAGHWMLNTGEILPIGHNESIDIHTKPAATLGACAGACLYDTDMIAEIGFYDPKFSTGYEDAEYGLRAYLSGYSCVYCPSAIVFHKMGNSIKKVFNDEYSTMIHSSILYTYFKLVPFKKMIFDIPSFLFKYSSMAVINLLFRRKKYMKVMIQSIKNTWKGRSEIRKNRKAYYGGRPNTPHLFALFSRITFFLWFDLKRFWSSIILNRDNSIDRY